MPRSSLSYALISDAALGSLAALGARLKEARLLRNWTQADAADKAGLSESSIRKVEAGSPHITVGAYVALLDVLGLPTAFDRVIARGDDTLGEALGRNAMRKRAHVPRAPDDDEFDI